MHQRLSQALFRVTGIGGLAVLLVWGQSVPAQTLFQHLDGSDAANLIDDNGVITWLDISGNDNHATDTGLGGVISAPSTGFPAGETGIRFDATSARAQMQLLDAVDAATILDQATNADGFSILLVVESFQSIGDGWNDLIGNTTAVGSTSEFVMRYGGSGGRFQAGVNGVMQNNTAGQTSAYTAGAPMVLGVNYDAVGAAATIASSLFGYSQTFGGRAPADFTSGGDPLFLGTTTNGGRYFDGQIGEVKIYDGALSADDFAAEMGALEEKWTQNPDGTLELIVDLATGEVTLNSPGTVDVDIVGLTIASGSGSLNPTDWMSINGNYDADSGDNSVDADDAWELISSTNADLTEATIGTTTIAGGQMVDLGRGFAIGGNEDVSAVFADPVTEDVIPISVTYVNETPADLLPGDFNDDGTVDAADYTVWRDNLGQAVTMPNETVSYDQVTIEDYETWRANFGATNVEAVIATPEPSGIVLGVGSLVAMIGFVRRRHVLLAACVAVAAVSLAPPNATADVFVDRLYLLGEDGANAGTLGSEGASNGLAVGDGNSFGVTFDWEGDLGVNALVDLEPTGSPVYADASGRTGNAGDLGVQFNGSNYLFSTRTAEGAFGGLGSPQEAFQSPSNPAYTGDLNRGMQMWVYPTNAAAAAQQDVINDTYQFGVHISENNNWSMTMGNPVGDTTAGMVVESSDAVEFDAWTHVMHYAFRSPVIAGVMWVDGVAVATYGFGAEERWLNTTPDGVSLDLAVGAALDGTRTFTGIVDDIEMFVDGGAGDAFGDFNLGEDNDFVVEAMAGIPDGDADLDGDVDDDDIAIFAENWMAQQDVDPREDVVAVIGDLVSRQTMADFNYDGRTDFFDWFILRANHPQGDGLILADALAANSVPEPASAFLMILLGVGLVRQRR